MIKYTALLLAGSRPGRDSFAERYGAVSMTLEMPFKDNDALPDPDFGWSPARSAQLAKDCLAVLAEVIGEV